MNGQETLNALALTRINHFNLAGLLHLYHTLGSATAIVEHRNDMSDVVSDCSPRLLEGLKKLDEALKRAEAELDFCHRHGIRTLCMNDDDYPQRLAECDDAPLVLFYKGTADLNQLRVISIVGTRHCTSYGQDVIMRFISDLRNLCPKALIVSGLAYGVDIHAHRRALDNGYETACVLAHGLDYIYPARHRDVAARMAGQGGLLTEFFTGTNADKVNFVRRNRIVAGMADATVLVESAARGGGLITARIARDYNRDVFAFPGRAGDVYSEGCNNLIRDNGAALINGAADFIAAMGWEGDAQLDRARAEGIERTLFPELSVEEAAVVDVLRGGNDMQINMLSVKSGVPIGALTAMLFELEMKGVVRTMAGGMYHLIG
ncbi:DNA-protecting protein DprA [Prevotella sp. PCHR]|uniref:DNA-protecting protein DprA n=1 Tax=Xylanibacter caecicola TaxID=2736294 RepID=A0ABX2AY58_9BACT|nr:DNA-processing protein DprA [Xylanibacter caecicola]NPE23968.1 DNA-protecting protein DprA [Xylanibacter caecicola]